jgi:hypothetical protein
MNGWDGPPRRLPRVLDVRGVMSRYNLRDARTARALMREAGTFTAGRRLMVREDVLDAWERSRARPAALGMPRPRARAAARRAPDADSGPLAPGWWKTPE